MINTRVLTSEDSEFVLSKYDIKSNILPELLTPMLGLNSSLAKVDENGEVEAFTVGALTYDSEASSAVIKILYAWGSSTDINLLLTQQLLIDIKVYCSSFVMKLAKQKYVIGETWSQFVPEHEVTSYVKVKNNCYHTNYLISVRPFLDKVEKLAIAEYRDSYYDGKAGELYSEMATFGITEHAPGVYSFPFLSKKYCKELVKKADNYAFKPNAEEPLCAQIPEVVLETGDNKEFLRTMKMFFDAARLSKLVYHSDVVSLNTAQLARYTLDTTAKGSWHTDNDSDFTLTVALSDTHKGGGTAIKLPGRLGEIEVPQLPVGHALVFQGKFMPHKGLPVLGGNRDLLVYWSEFK